MPRGCSGARLPSGSTSISPEGAADLDPGLGTEALHALASITPGKIQARRPDQRQIVAQQRRSEVAELVQVDPLRGLHEVAHRLQITHALVEALVQTGEARLRQVLELSARQQLVVVLQACGDQHGQAQAEQQEQAAEHPLAAVGAEG